MQFTMSPLINKSLKYKYVVKIADIEFASENVSPDHMIFTAPIQNQVITWTSPEVLSGAKPVSQKSDIFALAMVLYEIYNRKVPYSHLKFGEIADLYMKGERPPFEDDFAWKSQVSLIFKAREQRLKQQQQRRNLDTATSSGSSRGGNIVMASSDAFFSDDVNMDAASNKADGERSADIPVVIDNSKLDELINIESESRSRFQTLIHKSWAANPEDRLTAKEMLKEIISIKNEYFSKLKQCESAKLNQRLSKYNSVTR
jgi:hypothetical protein